MKVKLNQTMSFGELSINGNQKIHNSKLEKPENQPKDVAATLALSRAGRERARMLEKDEREETPKQDAEAYIDNILDTVRAGGKLTEDEEKVLNEELKNLAAKHQTDMKNYKLDPNDEGIMMALKENFLLRQSMFEDMQRKHQATKIEDDNRENNVMFATEKEKQEEKKQIIKMIDEINKELEKEDEDSDPESTSNEDSTVKEEQSSENDKITNYQIDSKDVDETEKDTKASAQARDKQGILKIVLENSANIDDMSKRIQNEAKNEREASKMLDKEYAKVMKHLDSDEITNEDKVKAYDEYLTNSSLFASEREIQRIKKEFDIETLIISRIHFNAHDDANEINSDQANMYSQLGTDFIKKFLI